MESERHDSHRDHVLRRPLTNTIHISVTEGKGSPEQVAEAILGFLAEAGMIDYAPKDSLKLLTPAGRVLVSLMERPDATMRELAMYLGITEAGIMKYLTMLVDAGLIARTKVKGRNTYRLNLDKALLTADIARLYNGINKAIEEQFPDEQ